MAGATSAIPAGASTTCCPTSRRSRTTRPAPTICRGRGGPLHVTDNRGRVHPLTGRFLKAAAEAGLPLNQDFNGAAQEGAGIYQINTKGGRRMSAARAFLRPAMKRKNVRVEMNALATKILFEGNRAIGVEYVQNGQTLRRAPAAR